MEPEGFVLLILLVGALLVGGSICGIAAFARGNGFREDLGQLRRRVSDLEKLLRRMKRDKEPPAHKPETPREPEAQRPEPLPPAAILKCAEPPAASASDKEPREPVAKTTDAQTLAGPTASAKEPTPTSPPPLPRANEASTPSESPTQEDPPEPSWFTLPFKLPKLDEYLVGTRLLPLAGVLLVIVGMALFLKFAYDNFIGEQARLGIGIVSGVVAVAFGERFRRNNWSVLFQAFTGLGIAVFYVCVYFSFEVYKLSGQPFSFGCAILVTVFAMVMAVAHNAVGIALLGLVGGFLSPVLIQTGHNQPYGLFTYLAVLNLVAIGAAYYRRWRVLDALCFTATAILYQGWYLKFNTPGLAADDYRATIFNPALLYTTVFYLMFMLIPTLRGLVRRMGDHIENVTLLAVNAAFSCYCYFTVLFEHHRQALGFVVLGQALLVFLLFLAWGKRVGPRTRTAESLLVIALALVTLAVPIQLKLYGVPLMWAAEAVMLLFAGIRFKEPICKVASAGALALAVGGLLGRLPLHDEAYRAFLNVPFGSWFAVIAAITVAALLLHWRKAELNWVELRYRTGAAMLAFVLGCALLTMEVWQYWPLAMGAPRLSAAEFEHCRACQWNSLTTVWAAIAAGAAALLGLRRMNPWHPLALVCQVILALVFVFGLEHYATSSTWLMLNWTFLSRAVAVASLWWGAAMLRRLDAKDLGDVAAFAGHALLTLLLPWECLNWAHRGGADEHMAIGVISAAWAVQAFGLIWVGLAMRNRLRRILGFVLFAVVLAKVCLLDTSQLEREYQILSFIASGLVALVGGYLYNRYVAVLLGGPRTTEA